MRGNITRRGKASWQIKFDVGTVNGKRQTRYATVRGTYKDAQKELTRLLGAADGGTLPDPTRMTVAEYILLGSESLQSGRSSRISARRRYRSLRQNRCRLGTAHCSRRSHLARCFTLTAS